MRSLSSQSLFEKGVETLLLLKCTFTSGQKERGWISIRLAVALLLAFYQAHHSGDYAFCAFFFRKRLASHGVSGSLTSSVYGDGASAADPASIVNQVQFAEIQSPMESTIGIKRSCKSQKENRSPDGPDKEGAEMIQLPFHVLKEIPGNLSE